MAITQVIPYVCNIILINSGTSCQLYICHNLFSIDGHTVLYMKLGPNLRSVRTEPLPSPMSSICRATIKIAARLLAGCDLPIYGSMAIKRPQMMLGCSGPRCYPPIDLFKNPKICPCVMLSKITSRDDAGVIDDAKAICIVFGMSGPRTVTFCAKPGRPQRG